jgi:hypothetical protein
VLTELEDLCSECVSYESFIEWKVSWLLLYKNNVCGTKFLNNKLLTI